MTAPGDPLAVQAQIQDLVAQAGAPGANRLNIAATLSGLSSRLSAAGMTDLAVTAQQAAVSVLQMSAAADAGLVIALAEAMHTLAARLDADGRHDEAIAQARSALATYRQAAIAVGTDPTEPATRSITEIATQLTILNKLFSFWQLPADALAAQQEAVDALNAFHPPPAQRADYALLTAEMLETLVARLNEVGQTGEASSRLVDEALARHRSARARWDSIAQLARDLAQRAIVEADSGHVVAAEISQRAAAEIISGQWSDPALPAGTDAPSGDPQVDAATAAATNAQASWQAALGIRAQMAQAVEQFHAVVGMLADGAPPGLADLSNPIEPSTFCDFGSAVLTGAEGPLTFGPAKGRWSHGALRVSVDPAGCKFFGNDPGSTPVSVIRSAFTRWQEVSEKVGRNFFQFSFVDTGQPAELQVTFVNPSSFDHPPSPGFKVAGETKPPEHGIIRLDNSRSWSEDELFHVALHEVGHALGLAHTNVPGSLMYPIGSSGDMDDLGQAAFNLLYGWLPSQHLSDRATNDRPTMAVVARGVAAFPVYIPQLVWRGTLDDTGIYHAQFTDGQWTPQVPLGIGECSHSPALAAVGGDDAAAIGNRVLMVWKGPGDDSGIYWSRQQSVDGPWQPQQRVPKVGTSAAPALAILGDRVYMVWKGVGEDQRIWFGWLDDPAENNEWTTQTQIAGVLTSTSPALVAWRGNLHMFWKGAADDPRAFHARRGGDDDDIWGPQDPVEYAQFEAGGSQVIAAFTDAPLAATARPNEILLLWKGAGERPLHVSLFDGAFFSGQNSIFASGSQAGPTIAATPRDTFAAWRGIDNDRTLYWSAL